MARRSHVIDVAVLVPVLPDAPDPWIDGALDAVAALRAGGADVEVIAGVPSALPEARVTICHGVQYEKLVADGVSRPVVVSDLLGVVGPGPVTAIDWSWPASAAEAARVAIELGCRRLGFVAGPPVPTQRAVVAAFADAAGGEVCAVHLPAFDDVEAGRRAGELLRAYGCDAIAHSADAAGAAAVEAARGTGVLTMGFLTGAPEDVGWILSDIGGALVALARSALGGTELPSIFRADETSGFGGFHRAARSGDLATSHKTGPAA